MPKIFVSVIGLNLASYLDSVSDIKGEGALDIIEKGIMEFLITPFVARWDFEHSKWHDPDYTAFAENRDTF